MFLFYLQCNRDRKRLEKETADKDKLRVSVMTEHAVCDAQ